jgi:hypothetical protein
MSGTQFVKMNEEEFVKEAVGIVEKAQSHGVYLRILGSLATYIRSLNNGYANLFKSLERFGEGKPLFTDLDLAGYSKQSGAINKFFHELNFRPDTMVNGMFGHKRLIHYHPQNKYHVDVFLNKLEFSHDVEFGEKPGSGRLELDWPTITATDIVLEKLQIHQINRKDLIDLVTLLMAHDVHERFDKNTIDGSYITNILSDDWGFWQDATTNFGKMKMLMEELTANNKLTTEQRQTIAQRTDKLLGMVTNSPKTKHWEKRSKTGTKKPWYREVEDIVR